MDGGGLGVFTRRPHPNAARVFANWVMTKKISEGISRADQYDARRNDIPPLDPNFAVIPGAKYVQAQRVEHDEMIVKVQAEIKKLRPQ
jgi:ABC-type Fe3+ transport system substrate-binding protein